MTVASQESELSYICVIEASILLSYGFPVGLLNCSKSGLFCFVLFLFSVLLQLLCKWEMFLPDNNVWMKYYLTIYTITKPEMWNYLLLSETGSSNGKFVMDFKRLYPALHGETMSYFRIRDSMTYGKCGWFFSYIYSGLNSLNQ